MRTPTSSTLWMAAKGGTGAPPPRCPLIDRRALGAHGPAVFVATTTKGRSNGRDNSGIGTATKYLPP